MFNFIINQLYIFFDADKINVRYEEVDYDYYYRRTTSTNPVISRFYTMRHEILDSIVRKHFSEGKKIVDLGSGSCEWNTGRLPVIGVDLNRNVLEYAKSKGHLAGYRVSSLDAVDFENNSVDIAVLSEVLEHIKDYNNLINEIYRILKHDGIVIVTVPYDTATSFWRPLFLVQCLIQGYIFGDTYYQNKCGHVHSFSPMDIKNMFGSKGFNIIDQFDMLRFTIFMVAQKSDGKGVQR
jgi:ubiquinone/menaquinone biosynthesis C-methylase UbiE